MASLGERLKQARENKGWSQTHVCGNLAISNSRLSGYERNYREPDTKMLTTLASLYEVSIDWLTGMTNQSQREISNQDLDSLISDPELQRWYVSLSHCKEEDLRKLKKIWEIINASKVE
ncbi:helix-turn-helix domain-containing protein [Halobacillus seohaensis]|uniref:Helix-turn-helix domain-containing protein n=1 Tax=Halobacillus seohaensis TaxID=447421 RepID=A0ABW2ELQ5_9BACI